MSPGVLDTMRVGLTAPYSRGMATLPLTIGPIADGSITIAPYSFTAYEGLYGAEPASPRYLLAPRTRLSEPVTVRFWFTREPGQPEETPVDVPLPAGWSAGRTVAVPIPGAAAHLTSRLRLTRFLPQPPAAPSAGDWEITALLGNLAKLLWAVGAEQEELNAQFADVLAQRHAARAHGASLDLLGSDLGVPRFPPAPYSVDDGTLALYHLDESASPVAVTVADDRARYQQTSHPGQNAGGQSGATGRFGGGFRFSGDGGSISIPDSPDFALAAQAPFTVEAVIKPDPAATVTGALIAKRSSLAAPAGPGWALAIGSFRGTDHNLRFSFGDGTASVEVFADLDLADGVFHHVAGVIDYRPGPPASTLGLLYVDGVPRMRQRADLFGPLTSAQPVVIGDGQEPAVGGTAAAPYAGVIDEARLSRVARTSFSPVTGEADEHYQRRLQVFQRWRLPTVGGLAAALNEMAGPVAGHPEAFVVSEDADPMVPGTLPLHVLPAPLAPGQGIGADGDQRTSEAAAAGTVADEPDFDPAWLCTHPDQPGVTFAGTGPGRPATQMQWSVRQALDALLARLSQHPAASPGTLQVLRAYDPAAADLHQVGRALLLAHDTIPPADLGVHAYAVGFGWVTRTGAGQVHVAQPRADVFRITPLTPVAAAPPGVPPDSLPPAPDLAEGQDLALGLDPSPAGLPATTVSWSVVRTGPGQAVLTSGPAPVLHATAAGAVTVHAEVTRRQRTRGGSRTIRIGLAANSLAPGDSIGGDGQRSVTEAAAAGPPDDAFSELYLQVRTDDYTGQHPNVSYGTDPGARRMQRLAALVLDRLLGLLAPSGGTLTVAKAYDPAGTGLITQGRALWLAHSALPAPALAAQAFAAGFDYVRIDPGPPAQVRVAVAAAEPITVTGPAEVQVGRPVPVSVAPAASPSAVCFAADGSRAFVTDQGSHRVTAGTLSAPSPGAFPQLALDRSAAVPAVPGAVAASTRVYVAHEQPGLISVLDPVTLASQAVISTGPRPTVLAADGTGLFAGCAGDRTLRAYSTQTSQPAGQLALPGIPLSIALVPGGASLYVVVSGNLVCRVNKAGLQLTGAPVAAAPGAVSAAVTPDGASLFVACSGDDPDHPSTPTVQRYSVASGQQTGAATGFPPGTRLTQVAVSADQRYLYVLAAAPGPGRVHIVDIATNALRPQVFTPGGTPGWLAVSPAGAPYQPCLLTVSAVTGALSQGDPAPLSGTPPRPPEVAASVSLGAGAGEELAWSTVPFIRGQVTLAAPAAPAAPVNQVTGTAPGVALVRALYLRGDGLRPYQLEVRLSPDLDGQPGVTISKDQYDLVMNVLNWLHPIGVEIRTARLRRHVVELSDTTDLAPAYTFPAYRAAGNQLSNPIRTGAQGQP